MKIPAAPSAALRRRCSGTTAVLLTLLLLGGVPSAAGAVPSAAHVRTAGEGEGGSSTSSRSTPPAQPSPGAATATDPDDPDATEPDPLWPVRGPSRADGAIVAQIVVTTVGRRRLTSTAGATRVSTQTAWSRQTQTLLVLDGAEHDGERWLKVLLGDRPNGRAAWIRRDHAILSSTRYWVDVSTRGRQVSVYRDGRRIRRFRAVVGAGSTPTPHTLSAVYERNRQPNPSAFLGPWVVALTAHSNVLRNYGGGPGRVAIHGRGGASLRDPLGSARSHGCIRIDNRHISFLARLPQGTPVDLHR